MYPSTNNNGGNYTFTHTTIQPITFSSFYDNCNNNDINLSQHHYYLPSSSPFQILSPEDHRRLNTNTVLHEQISTPDIWACVQSAIGKCSDNNGKFVNGDAGKSSTRRSTSAPKKNRHSKIYTARGPRDRRMRLSIEVAEKFFKLQDMLGFDKASETVDWLLMKSKSGIQELLSQPLIRRSPECDHQFLSGNIDDRSIMKSSSSNDHKESKKKIRKSAYLPRPLAKETREKARARARERTMVKSNRSLACLDPDLNLLDSNCTFNQLKQGTIDDNWSSSLFNYQHSRVAPHEHQLNDFQILGNLWEGNN